VLTWVFLFVELLFVGALLVGVWLIYPPAALIAGGLLGVVVIEMSARRLNQQRAQQRVTPQVRRVS
jgi:hypothetical protein